MCRNPLAPTARASKRFWFHREVQWRPRPHPPFAELSTAPPELFLPMRSIAAVAMARFGALPRSTHSSALEGERVAMTTGSPCGMSRHANRHLVDGVVAVPESIPFGAIRLRATGQIGGARPQEDGIV